MVQIITEAEIITGDPENPDPECVAVRGDTVEFVGPLEDAELRFGPDVGIRRFGGRTIVPGFNDNHFHMFLTGLTKGYPNLAGLAADEIVEKLVDAYPNPGRGQIVRGTAWDYPACPKPHRSILDRAFPVNPVVLAQYGGHASWMNSVALKRYGVTSRSKDPKGGQIVKDADGEPTGIVREFRSLKMGLEYLSVLLSRRRAHDWIDYSLGLLREVGITSVQDNTWVPPHVDAIRRLYEEGRLTSRFSCWHMGYFPLFAHWMRLKKFQPPHFHRGPWKYLLDGTFTTRTAWLHDEYADEQGNAGKGFPEGKIFRILLSLARHGRQGAFHAIGDRAITTFLDALERVYERYPDASSLRLRLEHAQLIRDEDIPRLRDLKVLVCAQPHAMASEEKDRTLLGEERAKSAYPFRKLLDAGVDLSFGSDYPGEESYAPLLGMHLAVNRTGNGAISPEEALACYTIGSAYAEFAEESKGRLKKGFLADMTVLEKNPLKVDPSEIKNIKVVETIVGGKTVYSL